MEADALIQAFRELLTVPRREVLGALVEQLTPYEWRALQQQLNARDFHFDIVGSLPIELVVHVFAYLDLIEVFRLQLVSRRWSHVLRSPDLLNLKLKAWYGDVPSGDYASRRQKAEQLSRLCTGRPYDSVVVPIFEIPRKSILVKDTFAWISKDIRSLRICNLRTGKTVQAHTEGRRRVYLLAASEEILAYVTDSACHVMTLDGKCQKRFRVTDVHLQYITCHGSIVSCGGFINNRAMLYNWDFTTGRGETVDISLPAWQTADCLSPM
ncbi:hypothetical protein K491DRAFT_60097 [Lophiostoma macrostomum CBS 122681]|uniref:F-box domain-containing protein n=1 Tax=Lophiostoma macrostomum CBS 122681 TaxID=1314788 RepID=A0A6A6TLY3_9PLEO|nr:hypothetical protein K491DRAFT_60097 [Lophiostoma macrostomum CBS 122681]